jgi:hypothetical protein
MKYTITNILPGQVRVEYEDGTWAQFPIRSDASLNSIDIIAGRFNPSFKDPRELELNPYIRIGDIREIKNPPTPEHADVPMGFTFNPFYMALAFFLREEGDPRLMDALKADIEKQIAEWGEKEDLVENAVLSLTEDPLDALNEAQALLDREEAGE